MDFGTNKTPVKIIKEALGGTYIWFICLLMINVTKSHETN